MWFIFFWELEFLSYYVVYFVSDMLVAASQSEVIYLSKQVDRFSFEDSRINGAIMSSCFEVEFWRSKAFVDMDFP